MTASFFVTKASLDSLMSEYTHAWINLNEILQDIWFYLKYVDPKHKVK